MVSSFRYCSCKFLAFHFVDRHTDVINIAIGIKLVASIPFFGFFYSTVLLALIIYFFIKLIKKWNEYKFSKKHQKLSSKESDISISPENIASEVPSPEQSPSLTNINDSQISPASSKASKNFSPKAILILHICFPKGKYWNNLGATYTLTTY